MKKQTNNTVPPVPLSRLVVHLGSIGHGFAQVGEVCYVLGGLCLMLLPFALTCNEEETMGEWHIRKFGKTLQDRFLHNVKVHTPLPATAGDETEVKP